MVRGAALCEDGDRDHDDELFHDGLDDPRTPAQRVAYRLHRTLAPTSCIHSFSIDTRRPAPGQRMAFAEHGWSDGPPTAGHVMKTMVRQATDSWRINALYEGRTLKSYPKALVEFFDISTSESGRGLDDGYDDQADAQDPWAWDQTEDALDEHTDDEAHIAGAA